jgi:hypothetical protein
MLQKKKGLLILGTLLSLGAVLIIVILLVGNQPGSDKKIASPELTSPSNPQLVYPAPKLTNIAQSVIKQSAYPPPSEKIALPTNTAHPLKAAASPTAGIETLTSENVSRTSPQDAKAAFDQKKAIFLDVRTVESYTRSHIPGAISIPEAQILERIQELDPNRWIIAYCS